MARRCEVCGKGQVSGNKVSHSMIHTRRKWNANSQSKLTTMVRSEEPMYALVA